MKTIPKPSSGIICMLLLCVGISHAQVSQYSLIPHGNLKEHSLICPSTITAGTVEYHDHGDANEFIIKVMTGIISCVQQ